MNRRAFWVLLILTLLNGADAATQAQEAPQYFRIKGAQLRSPEYRGKRVFLGRGQVLFPMTSGENRELYQPIFLCSDLDLNFDKAGLSQPVDFEGFCSAAKYLPATHARPEEKLQWEVTKLSRPDLAVGECEKAKQIGVREEQIRIPPQMNPESDSLKIYCRQLDIRRCFPEWRIEVEPIYKKTVMDLIAQKICSRREWLRRDVIERVGWILECPPRPVQVEGR